jgi:excisionase family DNA binding protein
MSDEVHGAPSTLHDDSFASSGWTTTKQAAKVLGVSRRTVQGYVRRGLLEATEEGEGVGKVFFISIDSLNALRDRRSTEPSSPVEFAKTSAQTVETANTSLKTGEYLRHAIDRLEARTVEATELRIRLELTEQAQSTLQEELAAERIRRDQAEREREELRRELEALQEPRDSPESTGEATEDVVTPADIGGVQAAIQSPERRSWWRRFFGFE